MIGGLLGYLSLGKRPRFRFQNALGLPGLALIASAVYFIDSNRSFPSAVRFIEGCLSPENYG